MKRFFFSLIALSAAAIGCTQSALLESPVTFNQEVSFSPYTGRTPETKATSIIGATGTPDGGISLAASGGFYVYSYLNQESASKSIYINNEHVTNPDGSGWVYDHLVYWPSASTSSLDFVAYSANAWGSDYAPDTANTNPKNDNIAWVTGKEGEEFIFTVPDAMESQIDLLATSYQSGYQLGKGGNTGDVELKFHHLLSRVGFKVQTTTSKPVTITSIKLKGRMYYQGTLNLLNGAKGSETPALTLAGTKADKEYSYLTASTTISGANSSAKPVYGNNPKYLMIMPHEAIAAADGLGSDHSILVSYKVGTSDNENHVSARLPIGFEFEAGKAYEFILKLSTSTLSFDVQEEEWNTDYNNNNNDDDDVTVGPLEPEEGDENGGSGEGPNVVVETATKYVDEDISLEVTSITATNALIQFNILSDKYKDEPDQGGFTIPIINWTIAEIDVDDKHIDILFRDVESSQWSYYAQDIGPEDGNAFTFNHNTIREHTYELFAKSTVYNITYDIYEGWLDDYITGVNYTSLNSDLTRDYPVLSFTTPSDFTDITLQTTVPDQQHYVNNGTNVTKAYLSHPAILAQKNGNSLPISEYGFCWMSGNGTPSKLNSYVSNLTETKVGGDLANGFSYTLDLLRPNATYTYCTYVVLSEKVEAYIIPPGKISAEKTLIYPANTILYSTPYTFMINPVVNEEDDTDTGWGEGGSTDILSENTTEQGNNNNN